MTQNLTEVTFTGFRSPSWLYAGADPDCLLPRADRTYKYATRVFVQVWVLMSRQFAFRHALALLTGILVVDPGELPAS